MNERIKQLALQSQLVYETTDGKVYNSWEDYVDLTEYVEKFAELIVKECARIVINNGIATAIHDQMVRQDCVNDIKQHFGVEEQVQDSKELHTCPYREEIHNDYESLCDCDEEQQHQCAMDI